VLFILLPVVPVGTWPLTVQLPLGLGAGGLFLGIGGIVHLGSNLTPLPHPPDDSYLVTTGVYRLVRHPIYVGVLFLALAYALWRMSLWHGIGVLGLGWFFDRKATQEEQWLTAKFPEYTAYQAAVNYSQLKQGAFSSPAVSKPTASLWGGLQHPQSTVTSALNNRFWCPQYNYNLRQLKLLKELSSPH